MKKYLLLLSVLFLSQYCFHAQIILILIITKISDILASPSKYTDAIVRVKGKVTESLVFFGQGYFVIADGTGVIAVVPSKTYPKTGEEVNIIGHVKNAFVIGGVMKV